MNRSPWSPSSYELAYLAAFTALGMCPESDEIKLLASMTQLTSEFFAAVRAMRDAAPDGRVFAALSVLRKFRDERPQT